MNTPDASVWRTIFRAWRKNKITIAAIAETTGVSVDEIKAYASEHHWTPRSHGSKSPRRKIQKPKAHTPRRAKSTAKLATSPISSVSPTDLDQRRTGLPSSLPSDIPVLPTKPANTLTARRALIRRMYSAIDTKLQLLEKHMQSDLARLDTGTDSSAADHERDTRAIGTLIKNLGTIADIDHANKRPKPGDAARDGTGDTKRAGTVSGSSAARHAAGNAGKHSGNRGHATDSAALADEADRYRRELAARLRRVVDAHTEPSTGSAE
jgi:hypothetical protein